jgi:hypothetical protein
MRPGSLSASALTCWLALASGGCASARGGEARDLADANDTGSTLGARSASERVMLTAVSGLPSGQPREVAGTTVVAEPAYAAASGRTCRALSLNPRKPGKASHRLACTIGGAWFFVPDVFGGDESRN